MGTETQIHKIQMQPLSVAFFFLRRGPLKRAKQWQNDIEKKSSVYRMKEERGREERKGCTIIQLVAQAQSNYFYSL